MENEKLNTEALEQVAGGVCLPDDASAEDIKGAARRTAREWKDSNMSLDKCLDMVSRYYYVPGKTTREMVMDIIREEYGD